MYTVKITDKAKI